MTHPVPTTSPQGRRRPRLLLPATRTSPLRMRTALYLNSQLCRPPSRLTRTAVHRTNFEAYGWRLGASWIVRYRLAIRCERQQMGRFVCSAESRNETSPPARLSWRDSLGGYFGFDPLLRELTSQSRWKPSWAFQRWAEREHEGNSQILS